jgi:hypothetical protein
VLEHLGGDDAVERLVGKRQGERVAVDHAAGRTVGQLTGVDHAAGHRGRVLELGGVGIEGDDDSAAPHRLERVPAAAATQVEQPLAVAQVETREVDRQHQRAVRSCASSRAR